MGEEEFVLLFFVGGHAADDIAEDAIIALQFEDEFFESFFFLLQVENLDFLLAENGVI